MKTINKERRGILPILSTLVLGFASAVGFAVMYSFTKYLLLLLISLILLMPLMINLFLFIFSGVSKKDGEEDITEAENTSAKSLKLKLRSLKHKVDKAFSKGAPTVRIILCALSVIALNAAFWLFTKRLTSVYKLNYLFPVILLVLFVAFIIFEKWCDHTEAASTYYAAILKNLRSAFALTRIAVACTSVAMIIKLIANYEVQKWMVYVFWGIFIYESVFTVISMSVKLIRRELDDEPDASIPMPFAKGQKNDLGIISYLEKNTGITMRSLWSIKLIKNIIPYTVIIALALFWLCTGIIQIESEQLGALYRFGRLKEEPLSPGLHFTLPWPFDKVELYNTETVNKITVGYSSTENTDNTWTGNHGSNEYKLVLGGGNELVSVNIRLEYKIKDLMQYLRCSNTPEKLLEAKAYEAITYRIVGTDLDSLLSTDRSEFSKSFHEELSNAILPYNTGIEVVSVVLESIHPPLEIGDIYQKLVSAEIDAEKTILDAEAQAAVKIADAEKSYDTAVSTAKSDSFTKIAKARADVAEFMASVEADNLYHDSYRYNKYLNAICNAYGNSRLVIVGDGIDSSKIYFGSFKLSE